MNREEEEFDVAVQSMKKGKASGADNIPAEVWVNSAAAKDLIFEFLQKIWREEEVSENLSLCVFIMIYKTRDRKMTIGISTKIGIGILAQDKSARLCRRCGRIRLQSFQQ